MVVKHIFEALLDSDLLGGPSPDSRALATLSQGAHHCQLALRKLGMSEEGALSAVNKALELDHSRRARAQLKKQ